MGDFSSIALKVVGVPRSVTFLFCKELISRNIFSVAINSRNFHCAIFTFHNVVNCGKTRYSPKTSEFTVTHTLWHSLKVIFLLLGISLFLVNSSKSMKYSKATSIKTIDDRDWHLPFSVLVLKKNLSNGKKNRRKTPNLRLRE